MLTPMEMTVYYTTGGWIGVDLDCTLAFYDGDISIIGKPIAPMVERVKNWIANGQRVKIFTARVDGKMDFCRPISEIEEEIRAWCKEHIGYELEVTNEKDGFMIELWDDRAVGVIPNTGVRIG